MTQNFLLKKLCDMEIVLWGWLLLGMRDDYMMKNLFAENFENFVLNHRKC